MDTNLNMVAICLYLFHGVWWIMVSSCRSDLLVRGSMFAGGA